MLKGNKTVVALVVAVVIILTGATVFLILEVRTLRAREGERLAVEQAKLAAEKKAEAQRKLHSEIEEYNASTLLRAEGEWIYWDRSLSKHRTTSGSVQFRLVNDSPYRLGRIAVKIEYYDKDFPSLEKCRTIRQTAIRELPDVPPEVYEGINPFKDSLAESGIPPSVIVPPMPDENCFLSNEEWEFEYYREAYASDKLSADEKVSAKFFYWDMAEPAKLERLLVKHGFPKVIDYREHAVTETIDPNSTRTIKIKVEHPPLPTPTPVWQFSISDARLSSEAVEDLFARKGEEWQTEVSGWELKVLMAGMESSPDG